MAAFDIKDTLSGMLGAIKGETGDGWKKVKAVAEQFAASNEKRLKMIVDLRISGEMDEKDFEKAMNDEKEMLEAQMNAISVISKAVVQKAVNAAFGVFWKAVRVAVPF